MRRLRLTDLWLGSLAIFLFINVHAATQWQTTATKPPSNQERIAVVVEDRLTQTIQYIFAEQLSEEFSFALPNFRMKHQGEDNSLNINVRYLYVPSIRDDKYPDFRLLVKDIEKFLQDYPNDGDYWEVVNKKMARMLLRKHPTLSQICIDLTVSPSKLDPYHRSSTVTLSRAGLNSASRGAKRATQRRSYVRQKTRTPFT